MSELPGRGLLTFHIGHEELVVRQRYEAVSILNDILIAAWFIVGSVMFFSEDWARTGTWCFLLGSVELMIRPVIRLSRQLHLRRISALSPGQARESSQDY
ncbi:YrhK family protein [Streptomyces sp. N2-109]|uniref:YrhK family protein n=1 Tax=Streptomyces gossypii TaxID=2883101 RepID=A0ABT2JZN6_9ACTN|nr:YrhK family protein [Streptomyces gossypii]MCT2592780.1 YrhK family protein [Streptomyces gossypii]